MTYYNASASTGSKYMDFVTNWTINNNTFVDYGDAVWVHLNKTVANGWFEWNASGEISR